MTDPIAQLQDVVGSVAGELRGNGAVEAPTLERPPKPDFGDYSTNAAMLLAGSMGEPPRTVAERLSESLGDRLGPAVERGEGAGPGFLNPFMGGPPGFPDLVVGGRRLRGRGGGAGRRRRGLRQLRARGGGAGARGVRERE